MNASQFSTTVILGIVGSALATFPAKAQYIINGFSVSIATAPTCDVFAPRPFSVSGNIIISQGTGLSSIDPFRGNSNLSGKSPYIALVGGSISYAPYYSTRYLHILWGSIDAGNSITFFDVNRTKIGEILGSDILSLGIDTNQEYFIIRAPALFSFVTLASSGIPFEFSDVSFSSKLPFCR